MLCPRCYPAAADQGCWLYSCFLGYAVTSCLSVLRTSRLQCSHHDIVKASRFVCCLCGMLSCSNNGAVTGNLASLLVAVKTAGLFRCVPKYAVQAYQSSLPLCNESCCSPQLAPPYFHWPCCCCGVSQAVVPYAAIAAAEEAGCCWLCWQCLAVIPSSF